MFKHKDKLSKAIEKKWKVIPHYFRCQNFNMPSVSTRHLNDITIWKRHFYMRLVDLRECWETLHHCNLNCNFISINFPLIFHTFVFLLAENFRGGGGRGEGQNNVRSFPIIIGHCVIAQLAGVIDLRNSVCSIKYWNIHADAPDFRGGSSGESSL